MVAMITFLTYSLMVCGGALGLYTFIKYVNGDQFMLFGSDWFQDPGASALATLSILLLVPLINIVTAMFVSAAFIVWAVFFVGLKNLRERNIAAKLTKTSK